MRCCRHLIPGYEQSSDRYPVPYLLHGAFGNDTDWTTAGDAEAITAGLPLIVVMPDGGQGGWYTDWLNRGAGGPPKWAGRNWLAGQLSCQVRNRPCSAAGEESE